jgi:hypothetical protein
MFVFCQPETVYRLLDSLKTKNSCVCGKHAKGHKRRVSVRTEEVIGNNGGSKKSEEEGSTSQIAL